MLPLLVVWSVMNKEIKEYINYISSDKVTSYNGLRGYDVRAKVIYDFLS